MEREYTRLRSVSPANKGLMKMIWDFTFHMRIFPSVKIYAVFLFYFFIQVWT